MLLYRQMVGRVIRPSPGKDHALILDHAGAVFQHGFIEDPMIWTLDKDTKARSRKHDERQGSSSSSRLLECSQCHAIRTGGEPCPHCGFMPKQAGEYVSVRDGDLAHLDPDYRTRAHQHSAEDRHQFHAMLAHIARDRGYKPGWAAHKFKEKFGHWPVTNNVSPIPPNAEVLSWERHCRIRYAKAMQKVVANG
jgi:DNA repair protein RadD